MPFFKTTKNILVDQGEYFDPNWMDSDSIKLPKKTNWTYDREMQVEDVDLWETVYEENGFGLYAAWSPYAEFYILRPPWILMEKGHGLETYYGRGAQDRVIERMKDFNIDLRKHKVWVENDDMWLYTKNVN